jgi:hypothetical protein
MLIMRSLLRVLLVLLLVSTLLLGMLVPPQMVALTSTGQDREVYDGRLPGIDSGIDRIPAKPGRAGYLEVWCSPHTADDIVIRFAIPGAPALPWGADMIQV